MLVGLDKQTIKPTVVSIDYEKLISCCNTTVSTEGVTYPIYDHRRATEQPINHIHINDNTMFNRLTIGTYKADRGIGLFCYLDISKMGVDDCNLVPYTLEGFMSYTDKCIAYIEERYGIVLNNNNYKGEVMEMNMTITLEDKFNEYGYLLELMAKLSPTKKRYKTELYYDKANEITGIKLKNGSVQKKIYDKKKQMETEKEIKIVLDKEYMRIEDTLLHQNKINDVFGTYNLSEITDAAIKSYLIKSINEDLIIPLEKHIAAGNKLLLKAAKEEKKTNNKKWIQSFIISALTMKIKDTPLLVDKQQILDTIKSIDKKNYNRSIKRAESDLNKLNGYIGNIDKLNEIKFKCDIN